MGKPMDVVQLASSFLSKENLSITNSPPRVIAIAKPRFPNWHVFFWADAYQAGKKKSPV
jgi:hypothetical protein